jgi:hypothetical protein
VLVLRLLKRLDRVEILEFELFQGHIILGHCHLVFYKFPQEAVVLQLINLVDLQVCDFESLCQLVYLALRVFSG